MRRAIPAAFLLLALAAAAAITPSAPAEPATPAPSPSPATPAPANPGSPATSEDAGAALAAAPDSAVVDDPFLANDPARDAKVPWKIGEYFQFAIDWNGLNGGSSLMQIQNIHLVDGRRCYRIVTKAESNSFVSRFYKVRDRAESSVDAESLYSRRFMKRLREGGYNKDVDVRFDQAAGKARYANGKEFDVAPGVHDVLSAFYYVRTRPLPDGGTLVVPTHDNEKSYEMEVQVLRREKVEVPAGKFACVVVEPKLKSEGIFKSKGSILVWLTDDERRLPVMVRSKVPVGSISVRLTDFRLAFEGRK